MTVHLSVSVATFESIELFIVLTELPKKDILVSNSCLVLPAAVKQQQTEISRNHIPTIVSLSVCIAYFWACFGGMQTIC